MLQVCNIRSDRQAGLYLVCLILYGIGQDNNKQTNGLFLLTLHFLSPECHQVFIDKSLFSAIIVYIFHMIDILLP